MKKEETSRSNSSNSDVIHLWIGYYFSCRNERPAICTLWFLSQSSYLWCVCETQILLLQCGMYCYRLFNNWDLSLEVTTGWQITKFPAMLHFIFVKLNTWAERWGCVCVCSAEKACERSLDNRRNLPFVSICLASPLSYGYKTPSSFAGSCTDTSSDTSNHSLKAYQQLQW